MTSRTQTFQIIAAPDDADAFVEEFSTLEAAVTRAAEIIRWESPEWPLDELKTSLATGSDHRLGDAGSIFVQAK